MRSLGDVAPSVDGAGSVDASASEAGSGAGTSVGATAGGADTGTVCCMGGTGNQKISKKGRKLVRCAEYKTSVKQVYNVRKRENASAETK